MTDAISRPLKVFLCHSSSDKPAVKKLNRYLKSHGINSWLDEDELLPGVNWREEIPKAVADSDVIIVCISKSSVDKEGYVQKEIRFALEKALEIPEGKIFLIPARLEECDLPSSLSQYQWVDLFREGGYKRLMLSLNRRAAQLGPTVSQANVDEAPVNNLPSSSFSGDDVTPKITPVSSEKIVENNEQLPTIEKIKDKLPESKRTNIHPKPVLYKPANRGISRKYSLPIIGCIGVLSIFVLIGVIWAGVNYLPDLLAFSSPTPTQRPQPTHTQTPTRQPTESSILPSVEVTATEVVGSNIISGGLTTFTDKNNFYAIDVPSGWNYHQTVDTQNNYFYIDTYTSPDGGAVIENIVYNDGTLFTGIQNVQFAKYLLDKFYSNTGKEGDITISDDKIMNDGSERLTWTSKGRRYSGMSFFEVRNETTFLMFTVNWADGVKDTYFDLLNTVIKSYRIP